MSDTSMNTMSAETTQEESPKTEVKERRLRQVLRRNIQTLKHRQTRIGLLKKMNILGRWRMNLTISRLPRKS